MELSAKNMKVKDENSSKNVKTAARSLGVPRSSALCPVLLFPFSSGLVQRLCCHGAYHVDRQIDYKRLNGGQRLVVKRELEKQQ